jgi:hypothetical protein
MIFKWKKYKMKIIQFWGKKEEIQDYL